MYHTIGKKYEETKDLDIKEIAKLVRKDLKENWKDLKFSVRIERYAYGQSIHVTVKNTGFTLEEIHDRQGKAQVLKQSIRDIVEAYNFDDSDIMSDYSHVRFYSHIKIED